MSYVCSTSAAVVMDNPTYGAVPHNTDTAGGLSDTSEYAEIPAHTSKKEADHEVLLILTSIQQPLILMYLHDAC